MELKQDSEEEQYQKDTQCLEFPKPKIVTDLKYFIDGIPAKKYDKMWRKLLHPLTRPAHIHPSQRVKWRLVKKWFNRYEKKNWLQKRILYIEMKDAPSIPAEIVNVRISKNGRRSWKYIFDCVATEEVKYEKKRR